MDIGTLIHQRRLKMNKTLEEVGAAVGVSKSTVQKWESGMISNMRRDRIAKLARVLELDPAIFIDLEDNLVPDDLIGNPSLIRYQEYDSDGNARWNWGGLSDPENASSVYEKECQLHQERMKNIEELGQIPLSLDETKVVLAYRKQPNMHEAVKRLLGIE